VGINAYSGAPLSGCVNDSSDFAEYLASPYVKFKYDNVRMLCDERATTQAILERLEWLVDVGPGDRCFFHYSGHGAQYPSRDYKQELDNMLEVICPVDFDWTPEHLITDKQFVDIFSRIPKGVRFNWVSDSCHSGDLTRDIGTAPALLLEGVKAEPCPKPRRHPVPADIAWRMRGAKSRNLAATDRGMVCGKLDVGFISGCRSDQTSMDAWFNGRPGGALTQNLLRVLKANKTSMPLLRVVALTSKALKTGGFSQTPQCEGARAKKAFLG